MPWKIDELDKFLCLHLTRALIGVWQVTGPEGGGGAKGPLLISGTNSWVGKIQTEFERSHRVTPELVPLTSLT